MAPMLVDRHDHSCGLVNNPLQGPEIIVAGGEGSKGEGIVGGGIGFYSRVDIYSINTDLWREGKINHNKLVPSLSD